MTPRERAKAARKLLDLIQYDYSRLNIYEFQKRREDVIEAAIAEAARALEERLAEWEGDKPTRCRLDKSDGCATILACHEVCQRFAGHTDLAPIAASVASAQCSQHGEFDVGGCQECDALRAAALRKKALGE